jgi:hypothetical protein
LKVKERLTRTRTMRMRVIGIMGTELQTRDHLYLVIEVDSLPMELHPESL